MENLLEKKIQETLQELESVNLAPYKDLFNPKLPRICRLTRFATYDYTPNSCMPSASFTFPDAPDAVQITEEVVKKVLSGKEVKLPDESDKVISMIKESRDELNQALDIGRLFVKPWKKPDDRFAMALPPASFGSTLGVDYWCESDEDFKIWLRCFFEAFSAQKDITGDDCHFATWAFNSTMEGNCLTQIVLPDDSYKINIPEEFIAAFSKRAEVYFSKVEEWLQKKKEFSDLSSSLKPYKSPGISNRNVNGTRFNKWLNYVVPNSQCLSGMEIVNGKVDKKAVKANGWTKVSTYGFKVSRIGGTLGKLANRLCDAIEFGFGNPKVIKKQILDDNANISLLSIRYNNPDEILYKGEPINSLHTFLRLTNNAGVRQYIDFQGKVREGCLILDGKYFSEKIDPREMAEIAAKKIETIIRTGKRPEVVINQKKEAWKVKYGTMIFKRLRGIMPSPYEQTILRNPYMKAIAGPLEKSEWGFASCSPKNPWAKATLSYLSNNRKGRIAYAIDLSHFETVGTTNKDTLLRLFGLNKRRMDFITDTGWTILAAMFEPIFFNLIIASGSAITSVCSLLFGLLIHALLIANLSLTPMATFEQYLDVMFSAAENYLLNYAKERDEIDLGYGIKEIPIWITFKTKLGDVECRAGAGSDDQGGWLSSLVASDEQLKGLIEENQFVKGLMDQGVLTLNVGDFTSFGVHRTRDEISQDVTSLLSKLFFIEHEKNGEAILFSFYLLAKSIPGADAAIDRCRVAFKQRTGKDVGDIIGFSRIAAAHYLSVITNSPARLHALLEGVYPKESPKGMAMSEALEASGFEEGSSLKLPSAFTQCAIQMVLTFINGGSVEQIRAIEKKAPTQQELFPRFDLQRYLDKNSDNCIIESEDQILEEV